MVGGSCPFINVYCIKIISFKGDNLRSPGTLTLLLTLFPSLYYPTRFPEPLQYLDEPFAARLSVVPNCLRQSLSLGSRTGDSAAIFSNYKIQLEKKRKERAY